MKPERMSTIEACIDDIRSAYEDLEMVKDEEQEAVSSKMKLPLKTRYMYFDLIEVIRK